MVIPGADPLFPGSKALLPREAMQAAQQGGCIWGPRFQAGREHRFAIPKGELLAREPSPSV